jgi:hypothetical protein
MNVSKEPICYESKCKNPKCDGNSVTIKVEPKGSRHFARSLCTKCKKFNEWITNPNNIKMNDPRASAILCYKFMLDARSTFDLKSK